MKKFAIIEKKVGKTPLQALENFRQTDKNLVGVPMTYAGRLDPMASGKLIILIGEECKRRDLYTDLDKEYEFEILLGFKSDTSDVLGLSEFCGENESGISEKSIYATTKMFVGKHNLPYPVYSSRTVNGKPLFHHAVENNLEEIKIPTAEMEVYKLEFCGRRKIPAYDLLKEIAGKISLLNVDENDPRPGSGFRKPEILACWRTFENLGSKQFAVLKFKAAVSSGTYIRALAPIMAEQLGTCGLAYSIHRTKIGKFFPITKHLGFWRKTF